MSVNPGGKDMTPAGGGSVWRGQKKSLFLRHFDFRQSELRRHDAVLIEREQGDQIGRIYSYRAIAYSWQFLKIAEVVQKFGILVSAEKVV
jgi:hypothetical protein